MTFTTAADRSRSIAPHGRGMKTPDYLEALVHKPINRIKWKVISDQKRHELKSAKIAAELVKAGIEKRRREKLDMLRKKNIEYTLHPMRGGRLARIYCDVTHSNWKRIFSPSRDKVTCQNRHILIWLIKRNTELSLQQIGRIVGGKDHSTILHAVRKIENNGLLLGLAQQIESAVLYREKQIHSQQEDQKS